MKIKINKQLIQGVNIYNILSRVSQLKLYDTDVELEFENYHQSIDKIVAFATTQGITIKIKIGYDVAEVPPIHRLSTHQYKNISNKETVYEYILPYLAQLKAEDKFQQDAVQRAREVAERNNQRISNRIFKVTDEVKHIINTYGRAYGFNQIRFDEQESTAQSHAPKNHSTLYQEWINEGISPEDIKRRIASWELKEKQNRKPTPISDIKRVYESIMYYLNNGIPFDDGYKACPICRKPFRYAPNGITELEEDVWCSECSPMLHNHIIEDTPEQIKEMYQKFVLASTHIVLSTEIDVYQLQEWTQNK